MAQRRMFSLKIINSARFLKMPVDSQTLYFHLGMHADDDGIVEAYPVLKLTGSSEDNLKILLAKGFIDILDNEDLIALIKDWHEHNLIRADRKIDSIYKNLLLKIKPDIELIEPKPRADTGKKTGEKDNNGQPVDVQMATNGQHRLGKVRLGKDSIGKDNNTTTPDGVEEKGVIKNTTNFLIDKFKAVNPSFELLFKRKNQRDAIDRLVKKYGLEKVGRMIDALPGIIGRQYAPKITTPAELEEKLAKYFLFVKENSGGKIAVIS